ncbi:hypothetical protein [Pantoea sp. KPR_PJ]|uniref:hypothetical protein n=1 Tax=Pantoea sp. KPR_PJ TaxID=2738375 RepID=UPI003528BA22
MSATHAECQVQLSEAKIAYAPATRGELLSLPGNSLTASELRIGNAHELDITVSCDQPSSIELAFTGAAKDSESYLFGANGRATLILHDVSIDNQPVTIERADQRGSAMAFTPGHSLRFWQHDRPATGTQLRGKVAVTGWIPSKETRVHERETWSLNGAFMTRSR